jgi:hypothetical protein
LLRCYRIPYLEDDALAKVRAWDGTIKLATAADEV